MKKCIFLIFLICGLFSFSNVSAITLRLTVECYEPATFPTITKIIEVPDMNDQLEISRQAALFALSSEGWDLEHLGLGGWLNLLEPPTWSGSLYSVYIPVALPVSQALIDLFGYELTEFGGATGPRYQLRFHTDEWVERLSHDIGETPNNYGVISGGMEGNVWHQCPVPNWGRFWVEETQPGPIQWKSELGGNDHWYEVIDYTTSWDTAKQLAEQTWYDGLQGHLVTITSIEEQSWIWNALPYSKKWLGGYQADNSIEPDRGWAWVTGENWEYTNWLDGEPNDNYGDEDYLVFSAVDTGQWNDQRLDGWNKVTGYVVEYEPASVPVPEPVSFAGWVAETPLSTPRDQFTGGVINGKIYVFGGNGDPDGVNLKSTEMFDPATRSWTYRATNENNNGFGVEELTGAVVNGKLYVFGATGEGYPPFAVFNFVEEYDPVTNTWTSKASMPTTRSGGTAAVYNGEIYVFGGFLGGPDPRPHTDVVEAYNPVTNTWRFVTNMPKAIHSSAIAVVGDKAYVIGGYFLDENRMIDGVIVYDFQTGTWITTGFTPLPTPRAFPYSHAVPVVDGKIYLVGGVIGTLTSSWTPLDVVEIYDTITDTWSTGPSLPQPVDDYLTVLLNRTIYVISGITNHDIRTGAVWTLNTAENSVVPDVKANGSDSSIIISQGNVLSVTVSLDPGGRNGEQSDWWLVADTPFGWYHYDVGFGSWMPGLAVTYQGPLFSLNPLIQVLSISGLPIGTYAFYFGVDMLMNGSLDMDQMYYDGVLVACW